MGSVAAQVEPEPEIDPEDERQFRAVLCAAAQACAGDRESMSCALLGALVVTADASSDPAGAIDAMIESLQHARQLVRTRLASLASQPVGQA